jgi:preprotein translocase subunit SecG
MGMSLFFIILSIILILVCAGLIVSILLQKKRQAGFSGNVAGLASDKTYFDKNKGRTLEGKLEKYTKFLGALFMLISLILSIYILSIQ